MKKFVFKNKEGVELKTTLSNEVMMSIANLTEIKLKKADVFHFRTGTKFQVRPNDIYKLLEAQKQATLDLIDKGVISKEDILNDYKANY